MRRPAHRVLAALAAAVLGCAGRGAHAQASAYVPLNLEPEMERQIERVLILAGEPILKRPYPVELVKLALPQACKLDAPLCHRVKRYLDRYARDYGVTHASITGSYTHGGSDQDAVPNQHAGRRSTSAGVTTGSRRSPTRAR